jgi:hypothetical protein
VVPGAAGRRPDSTVSYQRFSDPTAARQAVRDGQLPAGLSRVLGAKARALRGTVVLAAWTAVYALGSAALGVVLMDLIMGALTGHPWALLGAGTLIVFAATMSTLR